MEVSTHSLYDNDGDDRVFDRPSRVIKDFTELLLSIYCTKLSCYIKHHHPTGMRRAHVTPQDLVVNATLNLLR